MYSISIFQFLNIFKVAVFDMNTVIDKKNLQSFPSSRQFNISKDKKSLKHEYQSAYYIQSA